MITLSDPKGKANMMNIGNYTAMDIYRNGYRNGFISRGTPESKKFFIRLRATIINELETMGFSELIDYLIESGKSNIDIIVFAVAADIAKGYSANTLTDVESDNEWSVYIPYVPKGKTSQFKWEEAESFNYLVQPMTNSVYENLYLARQTVRNVHAEHVESRSSVGNGDIHPTTKRESEEILEKARLKATSIIDEAKKEADRILENAQNAAKTIMVNATEQAQSASAESASQLITQYIADDQKRYKRELNDEMVSFSQLIIDNSKRTASFHSEMCDSTNAFQAEWVRALDDTLERINTIKAEFYSHLHDWQVSLYPSEIRPLAERYLELYRIINVDKLLREEVVFRNNAEQLPRTQSEMKSDLGNTPDESTAQENAISDVENRVPLDSTISGLQRLNKTLSTFLRRFEASLNGLDLYVYYPKAGDEFDEVWHVPEDEDIEYFGRVITECLVPGIAKKANDDQGDDVLIRAVVRVAVED